MIQISDRSKLLILVVAVVIIIYFLTSNASPIHNEGKLTYNYSQENKQEGYQSSLTETENSLPHDLESRDSNISSETEESRVQKVSVDQEGRSLKQKMLSRDSAVGDEYKSSSYKDGNRSGKAQNLDKFFEDGNPFANANKGFDGLDETNGKFAGYVPGKKQKMTEEDKFNVSSLLPDEDTKGYFDDVYTTSVKNRHLINIYRPVGVNTISTTLKNPSWDFRGTPINPKYNVSPWNQSSWEPDTNIKDGALC